MDVHENARTTRHSRMRMVQRLTSGWSVAAVASAQGVTTRTVRRWRDRHAFGGDGGLGDRSSRPHHSPARYDFPPRQRRRSKRSAVSTGPAPPSPGACSGRPRRSVWCCVGVASGGLTTKIHALVDADGMPIALKLTAGQAHDGHSAQNMFDTIGKDDILLANRA